VLMLEGRSFMPTRSRGRSTWIGAREVAHPHESRRSRSTSSRGERRFIEGARAERPGPKCCGALDGHRASSTIRLALVRSLRWHQNLQPQSESTGR
jgi:hypothetical protein